MGFFFFFNLAFFLSRMWCPDKPATSSTAQAEASKAECQHMDSSSTNLVHNSLIKPENRKGHLTHQCYLAQRLLPGIDDCGSLDFPAVVTGWVGKSQKYSFTIGSQLACRAAFDGPVCEPCIFFIFILLNVTEFKLQSYLLNTSVQLNSQAGVISILPL